MGVTKRMKIEDLDEQLADKTIDILYLNAGVMDSRRSISFSEQESPEWEEILVPESSYVHLTSNNALYGTQWQEYPDTGEVPLVSDSTSDILSRKEDYSRFGLVYAGLQKNLGPSGLALVLEREYLLGLALPQTPKLLDYQLAHSQRSLANTTSVYTIYVTMQII